MGQTGPRTKVPGQGVMQMPAFDGSVRGGPRILLRLEGAILLASATAVYLHMGYSWWMFFALILLPDVSMLGYLVNARIGALIYNAVHSLAGPAMLAGYGFVLGGPFVVSLAMIWVAHIGMDRALGYGLKYSTGFADTHLGQLGTGRGDKAAVSMRV
jgi:hypothetical protein